MAKKRYRREEIIAKLREADVLLSRGAAVATVVKVLEVSEGTSTAMCQKATLSPPFQPTPSVSL